MIMKKTNKLFTKLSTIVVSLAMALGVGVAAASNGGFREVRAESYNSSFTYANQGTAWTQSNFEDASSYWKSSSNNDCTATVSGIFTNKTVTSNVVITIIIVLI